MTTAKSATHSYIFTLDTKAEALDAKTLLQSHGFRDVEIVSATSIAVHIDDARSAFHRLMQLRAKPLA